MNKSKPTLSEPAVFGDVEDWPNVEDLPNFVGHVTDLDCTSKCFIEYASNVGHIKPFKVRMPLGWSEEIKPIHALPDETNNTS